jgi:hypothetical protein
MGNLTQREKSRLLDSVSDDLTLDTNYVFVSRYTPWTDDDAPPEVDYSTTGMQDVRDEILVGKKISSTNVRRLIRRVDWTSNTSYEAYASDDADLGSKDFYVLTSANRVYKCLKAGAGPSTVEPTILSTTTFTTADGYSWKYMFSVPQEDMDKFADASYFPFSSNSTVENAAVSGTVDSVRLDASGNNWLIYETGAVAGVVSNSVFKISSDASPSVGRYVNSSLYVISGGGAGYVGEIVSYTVNSSGNFVQTDVEDANVAFASTYVISPTVKITGDGTGAKAYSTVNTATAVIDSVVVISPGNGYTWANVSIYSNTAASNTQVSATAMLAPRMGHGYDPKTELYSDSLRVVVDFTYYEAPATAYRQAGILRQPSNTTGSAYSTSTFTAYTSANASYVIGITDPPAVGEVIVGDTSGATATVAQSNSTYLIFSDVTGIFSNNEVVISQGNSGSMMTLTGINTPQINVDTGSITYFENFEPLSRSDTSSERVRLTIRN